MKIIISHIILGVIFSFASVVAVAEEWKKCTVGNSLASQRDAAIAFGKIDKTLSFFKKTNFASISIFLDGKPWQTIDLVPTGRGLYSDGKPYLGYASRNNSVIVQDFEGDDIMIVGLKGDVDFTMFAKCR